MNPFDYVTSITSSKKDLMIDDLTENSYNPFMVNRSLSYFSDTAIIANEMNKYHSLDKKLQYQFLINIIRKRKRFSKWNKPELVQDVDVVKEYYGYSNEKARQILPLRSSDQIMNLREKVQKGGRRKQ